MKIVFFNYSAIVLLICLILITLHKSRRLKSESAILYIASCVVNLMAAIGSTVYIHFDNLGAGYIPQKYTFHTMYLFFHTWAMVVFFFYLISLADDWQSFFKRKFKTLILFVPIGITTLVIAANHFIPLIYFFNENDEYTRIWPLFGLLYAITAFYSIYGLVYSIIHRKLYTANQFLTIVLIFPILAFSLILELKTKYLVVESFFDAIGLLFVCANIQRTEECLTISTGLLNQSSYNWTMKRAYANKKRIYQIIINITNYDAIQSIVGYKNKFDFLSTIVAKINFCEKKVKGNFKNFDLDNGNFRIVADERYSASIPPLAEMLNETFKETYIFNGININMVVNVCVMANPDDIEDYDTVYIFSNEMNKPKYYTGKVLYAKDIYKNDYYLKLRNIDQILLNALKDNNFRVYYQPIYSIKEKKFNSAEALLRLFDYEFGTISPDFFIPAAEQNGLIYKITDFVLDEVCRFIASKEFEQLGVDYIEINLSAAECMQENLTERIMSVLNQYSVSPSKLNIEITETALTLSEEKLYENLSKLVDAGLNISLDDFGSGYSNLQRITMIPLDIVKFDKSFIYNIKNDETRTTMISNMGKMIHEMNIKFLIEGVETHEILEYFENLNCDYVQGYYFSKPISQTDFIEFIKKSKAKQLEQ